MPDAEGGTPLTAGETAGLIPTFVATRADLNLVEQANIAAGRRWAARARAASTVEGILDDGFVRQLHRQMYSQVWRWAGQYRTSERNIGIDPARIAVALRDLVANARYWVAPDAGWITSELACLRVHHQFVAIHPFPNGNGRHARAYADLLMRTLDGEPFSWGAAGIQGPGPTRQAYLDALRAADADPENIAPLVRFARS